DTSMKESFSLPFPHNDKEHRSTVAFGGRPAVEPHREVIIPSGADWQYTMEDERMSTRPAALRCLSVTA
ncbi:MAG: hypothetical protein ACOC6J_10135, partial [Spirochaetota bacterium]